MRLAAELPVFLDPPFNVGHDYGDHFVDRLPADEYLDWCKDWLEQSVRVLKPGGALYLFHMPAMIPPVTSMGFAVRRALCRCGPS